MAGLTMPYASALFDLAEGEHRTKEVLENLEAFTTACRENRDIVLALQQPEISREEKKQWLKNALQDADPLFSRFMQVVAEHGMADKIPEIEKDYLALYDAHHGIIDVRVETAAPLKEKEQHKLEQLIEDKLHKKARLNIVVDPALLAGLRVQAGGFTLDNTMQTRLRSMQEKLKS